MLINILYEPFFEILIPAKVASFSHFTNFIIPNSFHTKKPILRESGANGEKTSRCPEKLGKVLFPEDEIRAPDKTDPALLRSIAISPSSFLADILYFPNKKEVKYLTC